MIKVRINLAPRPLRNARQIQKNYHIVVNAGDISSYKRCLGRMKSTD